MDLRQCVFCQLAGNGVVVDECEHSLAEVEGDPKLFSTSYDKTMERLKAVAATAMYPAISLGILAVMEEDETLPEGIVPDQLYSRTHEDGWTISAFPDEDYFVWVSVFYATHPELGRVWGNFDGYVFADSENGFDDFFEKHTPYFWDMADI